MKHPGDLLPRGAYFAAFYEVARQIPPGRVATYGQLARLAGHGNMARQVGWALHQNPEPGTIPCYRVVNRLGQCSAAFAFGGAQTQRALLEAEGVAFLPDGTVDMEHYLWEA